MAGGKRVRRGGRGGRRKQRRQRKHKTEVECIHPRATGVSGSAHQFSSVEQAADAPKGGGVVNMGVCKGRDWGCTHQECMCPRRMRVQLFGACEIQMNDDRALGVR